MDVVPRDMILRLFEDWRLRSVLPVAARLVLAEARGTTPPLVALVAFAFAEGCRPRLTGRPEDSLDSNSDAPVPIPVKALRRIVECLESHN